MDARRRSARLWCLVAACCKLLLMAAAATDDPELRATRRARAACNWAAKLFVIEDHVDDSRYSAAGGERCTVELFGICEDEICDDVVDLATWPRLQQYIRALQLPSEGSVVLKIEHEVLGRPHVVVTSGVTLLFHGCACKVPVSLSTVTYVAMRGDAWRYV
jgi:hypothetical protein